MAFYNKAVIEFFTSGIVLDKSTTSEEDGFFVVFTEDLGKIYGQATSSRKIISKLSPHLEPASFSKLRLTQKAPGSVFKIVDALVEARQPKIEFVKMLHFVDQMTSILQPDRPLFNFLQEKITNKRSNDDWLKKILKILGFDPNYASCDYCGRQEVAYFVNQDIIFLCRLCAQKASYPPEKLTQL